MKDKEIHKTKKEIRVSTKHWQTCDCLTEEAVKRFKNFSEIQTNLYQSMDFQTSFHNS